LVAAIKSGNVLLVSEVIALGVNVNALVNGLTPLHYACTFYEKIPHVDIARVLLDAKADVNIKAGVDTVLHYAVKTGNLELVKLLVDAGVTLNDLDDDGMGALKLATELSDAAGGREVADYLASKGAKSYG
jgi:ankyrin repeat protein